MVLVFFLLLVLILLLSQIRIDIKKFNIKTIEDITETSFLVAIGIYLFGKIKLISININEKKLKKVKLINKLNKKTIFRKAFKNRKSIHLTKVPFKVDSFKLNIKLGLEDSALTSYIIGLIGAVIGAFLGKIIKKYDSNKYYYKVTPIYNMKNSIDLDFNCIIYLKMVHIIHAIYIILKRKRSDKKNERTSDRRTYDYSYG